MTTDNPWTAEEFEKFKELCRYAAGDIVAENAYAAYHMPAFIEKHGKAKCDAMFAEIKKGDSNNGL